MRCPSCDHDNRPGAKFCEACAAPLKPVCVSCGAELRPTAKFCDGCGASVNAFAAPLPAPAAPPELSPAVATASRPPLAAVPFARACPPATPRPRHRLAAVDWLLLGTLLPLCVFGFVMSVVHGVRGDFVLAPFLASSAPDEQSYPMVDQLWSSPSTEASPLAVGDRLLRLEGIDLRGVSNIGFILRWSQAAQAGARSLLLTIERGSVRSDVLAPLVPGYLMPGIPWWATLPFIVGSVGTALLLLVRAAHWHLARRCYVASLLVVFCSTPYFSVPTAPRANLIRLVLVFPLAFGLSLWSLNEFLPGLRLWGPGQRAVAGALALLQSASFAAVFWLPDAGLAMGSGGLAAIAFVIADLVALTRVYQRADPLGRRQLKWVVYGFYVGLLAVGLVTAVLSLSVVPEWIGALFAVAMIALVAVPLGVLIAIAFYEFLDIDRLFSATLSYSVLAILGLAIVLGVMPTASQAASDALGLAPAYGQMLFALGLAAIVVPAQRVVRPRIDRLLFPQRLAIEQGFEHLLAAISGCADMQELTRLVGERLDALLQPAAAVVYARAQVGDDVFTPLAVRGRTAPPAFAAQSTLIAALQERTTPLAAERWTARRAASLTPCERAAIETLDVAVLVPFRRGPNLVAFSCLGPKRSGDIYTPTDLAWLGAVAGKVSDRLLALDATAVAEQARAMQEALRRYVPGAVAARLASGQDIEAGEREVTVLFVDIRGYTAAPAGRRARRSSAMRISPFAAAPSPRPYTRCRCDQSPKGR
jgi:Double zinc ribbon